MVRAEQAWLARNPRLATAPCRFDVVAVREQAGQLQCQWFKAAFTLDDL